MHDKYKSVLMYLHPEFLVQCTRDNTSFKKDDHTFLGTICCFKLQITSPVFQLGFFQWFHVKIWTTNLKPIIYNQHRYTPYTLNVFSAQKSLNALKTMMSFAVVHREGNTLSAHPCLHHTETVTVNKCSKMQHRNTCRHMLTNLAIS